jgi:hypothetical protein
MPVILMLFLLFFCGYGSAGGQDYFALDDRSGGNFVESVPIPQDESRRICDDLCRLFAAYPMSCTGIEITEKQDVYVIMKNGARIIYDDHRKKSFEEKLADPDLHDMLEKKYVPGPVTGNPAKNCDPGRLQVTAFFQAIYGRTEYDVIRNTRKVAFANYKAAFNAIEGAADALGKVHGNLSVLMKEKPELAEYVNPVGSP